jgi:RNA polymerase sigma-70 factor (TIGR02957 family)
MPGAGEAEVFQEHRELLFAVAYRMLGTVADAEDAVQDAWLRWSAASRDDVAEPGAYLIRIVTNTALNRLRAARARREAYVGPWLPEPLLTEPATGLAERAELEESVSVAMLVVLESLPPEERAVFVLREVFGFPHAEIGAALGRPGAAVRQRAHRAREHVQARRPRFEVDPGRCREVTSRFLAAAVGGDLAGLMAVLAPEVILTSDGGGKVQAALRPITGAGKVARFIAAISDRPYQGHDPSQLTLEAAEINGGPGVLVLAGGRAIAAVTFVVAADQIAAVHIIGNPDKLDPVSAGRILAM